eukprot:5495390-Prymnesium_polylepis.1
MLGAAAGPRREALPAWRGRAREGVDQPARDAAVARGAGAEAQIVPLLQLACVSRCRVLWARTNPTRPG